MVMVDTFRLGQVPVYQDTGNAISVSHPRHQKRENVMDFELDDLETLSDSDLADLEAIDEIELES